MSKRKTDSVDQIRAKIRRLESKLVKKRRRRLIITSSSSEDELTDRYNYDETTPDALESATKTDPAHQLVDLPSGSSTKDPDLKLDDDIIALLGDTPQNVTVFSKPIHKDIADRWHDILVKGLSKETKEKLLKEYLIPSNCEMLLAPQLNPETKAAIVENLVKRDSMLETKRNQIGIALAALSQTVESILEKDFSPHRLLKPICDACRILADSHYNETKTRRHFIVSSINSELKDTMMETVRDKYLFGENVSEKLKSAKTILRSGIDLKQKKPLPNSRSQKFHKNNLKKKNKNQLNWKPLQRRSTGKADAGSQSAHQQNQRTRKSGVQHREAVDRSPPRRQRNRRRQ